MSEAGPKKGGGLAAGTAHLRAEWGRWWRTEDLTDTHIAHRVLNDQYRTWMRFRQRNKAEVSQNIGLLKEQQKIGRQAQMMQMNAQRQRMRRGGYGGYYGGGGASPVISYRVMQWSALQMRMGQEEFRHTEVTPSMLAIGRGQVRSRRHLGAGIAALLLPAAWIGLAILSVTAAVVVAVAAALVFTVAAAAAGRNPGHRRPPVPRLLFVPAAPPAHTELAEPEPQPFPLREAGRDPRRVRECMTLALAAQRAKVADVLLPQETSWGWSVPVVLSGGTLGDLIRILPSLTTVLRVGAGRILAQRTNPDDGSAITVRILTSDPFANPGPFPVRAPRSASINDPCSIGISIDGDETPVILAGQHALIVADSGGGKSAMVRALVEYATACVDAVVVDVDPTGRGLGPLRPCAVRSALSPQAAEAELEYLLGLARARIATMDPAVDNWPVTAESPAVIVAVDEWPQLTKRGKAAGVALMRIGRKARITLVIVTQDATDDVMSDAIADAIGLRIMMPCRAADVPLVVGQPDAIAKGWLPHHLVPSPGEWEPADAGKFYCITPRHREPILRYVRHLDAATAAIRAQERVSAGLPVLTAPAPPAPAAGPAPAAPIPAIAAALLSAFATHGDPESLTVAQIADHLAGVDPTVWRQWDGRDDRLAMIGRRIQKELRDAGLAIGTKRLSELPGRPTGYRLKDLRGGLS